MDSPSPWTSIDGQAELDALDRNICWDDSNRLELYATSMLAPGLPSDVNRSGFARSNYYALIHDYCVRRATLEFAFIHVHRIGADFLKVFTLRGHIDALKRVELIDWDGEVQLQCARLAYRVARCDPNKGGYFARQWPPCPSDDD